MMWKSKIRSTARLLWFDLFLKNDCFLFDLEKEERQRQRDLKWLQRPVWSQCQASSLELPPDLPHGCGITRTYVIYCHFPDTLRGRLIGLVLHRVVPRWDAGTIDRSLNYYVMAPEVSNSDSHWTSSSLRLHIFSE